MYDATGRRGDDNAGLRRDIISDLRAYPPLDGIPVYDRWSQPSVEPIRIIVDMYGVSSQQNISTTGVNYEVEAAVIVTQGWIDDKNQEAGTSPGQEADKIMDAVSERAHHAFGISGLSLQPGGGGGNPEPPDDVGQMSRLRLWRFNRQKA